MSRYSVTNNKAGVNVANTIMWQLRGAAAGRVELLELGLSIKVAPTTGPSWRLNRPTAVGATFTSTTPITEDDPADVPAATTRLDTVMGTPPTLLATDLREYSTPNAIGSGIVWSWWTRPLRIAPSMSLAIVNGNAVGTTLGSFTVYAVFDE
jgi:hypothetical protein